MEPRPFFLIDKSHREKGSTILAPREQVKTTVVEIKVKTNTNRKHPLLGVGHDTLPCKERAKDMVRVW